MGRLPDNSVVSPTLDKHRIRVVAIGDIGVSDGVIHIGDEAMFEALVTELRSRGVHEIVGISSNPADSRARYDIDAIDRIGFSGSRGQMANRMSAVLRAADGEPGALEAGDSAWAVIAAIRSSDGVAIAGGGNLASTWPLHIFERATIAELARLFERPLVISGQTLGPELSEADRALVARMLASARLVGVREQSSFALAATLGVTATATIDDASFLGAFASTRPYCLVTFSTHLGGIDPATFVDRAVELLDSIELEPVFLAHFGSTLDNRVVGDSILHERVRARTGGRVVVPTDAIAAATLAREASLVVTSRYHPAVFAVSSGVPTIGIPVDEYTRVKLSGALGNFGQAGILPMADLVNGAGPALAATVWAGRDSIRADSAPVIAENRAASTEWWNRVAREFGAGTN